MPPRDLNIGPDIEGAAEGISVLKDQPVVSGEPTDSISGLVHLIQERKQRAMDARFVSEQTWLKSYQNYRGVYDEATLSRLPKDKSRVFVKITKVKVLAAYGQLQEVIFGANKFPIGVEPTILPDGVPDKETLVPEGTPTEGIEAIQDLYGFEGDGNTLPPGATMASLGGTQAQSTAPDVSGAEIPGFEKIPGPSPDATKAFEIDPAEIAAKQMEKQILDQLEESHASTVLRYALFEASMLGTGIVKGPFNFHKTINKWELDEEDKLVYMPEDKVVPRIETMSIWNFYPDPDGRNMETSEWVIERHKMNRSEMRMLLKRPFFRKEALNRCIADGPQYTNEWWEDLLVDNTSEVNIERFEVLEYWGIIDKQVAIDSGLELELDDFEEVDELQINAWICGTEILRLVVNPFIPRRIPYLVFPYEIHPYQFWGVGVAENMADSQQIMNGHARMAIDNLKLAGNLVFDVDENSLVPGQTMDIFPGKIFRRNGGTPGQAIFGIKFPSTANENMQMFDIFRRLSDEQTGISSFSHGQTGVMSPTRTASGMSMLLGAGSLTVKSVVKNIDDFLLQPLGEAMFAWNMQFNPKKNIRGDLEVKSRGTVALMQKEVLSQRLLTFLQVAGNPQLAPFVRWHNVLRTFAEVSDLDPDKFTNNEEQAALYASIIGAAQGRADGEQPIDPTGRGGGNIGTGEIAQPGSPQFSGTSQQQGSGAPQPGSAGAG